MDGTAMIREITPFIADIAWLQATGLEPGQRWNAFNLGWQAIRQIDVGLSQNLSSPSPFEFARQPWDHRALPLQHFAEVYIPLPFPRHICILIRPSQRGYCLQGRKGPYQSIQSID